MNWTYAQCPKSIDKPKLQLGYVLPLRNYLKIMKRIQIEFQNENEKDRTLLRRCSSGMPETFPISPGMYSTKASAENGLDPEATEVRRRRAWLDKRCRELAIASETNLTEEPNSRAL